MNININRINRVLTAAEITSVKTAFTGLNTTLNFLIGLTTDERVALPKVDVSNKAFVQDSINALTNNASLLPGYISVANIQTDLTLFNQLDELATISRQFTEKLEDTMMLAGSEAYVTSLASYRFFEAAANAGMPGAAEVYNSLKARFATQGGGGNTPAPGNG